MPKCLKMWCSSCSCCSCSMPLCLLLLLAMFISVSVFYPMQEQYQITGEGLYSSSTPKVESGYGGNEVERVSGKDEIDETKSFLGRKVRLLLGLESREVRKRLPNEDLQSSISPSPSPSHIIEAAPLIPTVSVPPTHPHKPRRSSSRPVVVTDSGNKSKNSMRTLVIALASAIGGSVVIVGIICVLVYKYRRRPRERKIKSNQLSKVSFDPGPDLFCLDPSWPVSETVGLAKPSDERSISIVSATFNRCFSQPAQAFDQVIDSTNLVLEVEEDPELEQLSSDDESFHSPCCSTPSSSRHSNVSDTFLSNASEISSPSQTFDGSCEVRTISSSSLSREEAKPAPTSQTSSSSSQVSETAAASPSNLSLTPPSPPPPPPPPLPALRRGNPFPPPPPPTSRGGSTARAPPPLPLPLPLQATPTGKDGAPLPKLKPLHWDKVRATSDRSMVWDKLRSSSFELDEEMIGSLFGYKMNTTVKPEEFHSKTPSPTKHVLDQKRLQNITILSKALNATSNEICDALVKGKGLSTQQLEALVRMAPTKDEEEMLLAYNGDLDELCSGERFVKELLTVSSAFQRIEAMLYRDTFEDEVIHLKKSFAMLEEACKELRSSRLFLKLLEAVLKTGNRMNVGTIRGGAKAFKLDALLKLADVKGTDGKTTLLHFVVQEMIRSEGARMMENHTETNKFNIKTEEENEECYKKVGLEIVSGLSKELLNVKKTATIDLDVLETSVSNLSGGVERLQQLISDQLPKNVDGEEGFSESMRLFLEYAEEKIQSVKKDEDEILLQVREITEYFHGNGSKDESNPLRIFVIVRDFLGMLDKVCKEVKSLNCSNSLQNCVPFFK